MFDAVMLSFKEFEHLRFLEGLYEQLDIQSMLEERLQNYNPDNNVKWDQIREDS